MNHHEFGEYAGAYVLGSLSPQERRAFEAHLRHCTECAEAVREFAPMPGLLAMVPPNVAEPRPVGPVPPALLPRLVREARGRERRRRWTVAGVAAAAAAVVAGGGVVVASMGDGEGSGAVATGQSPTGSADTQGGEPMTDVAGTPLQAQVAFTDVAWGTRLDLTCTYPSGRDYRRPGDVEAGGGSTAYQLVVRSVKGETQQVGAWQAVPGKTLTITGASSWARGDIAAVELRDASGRTLLELAG